MPNGTNEKKEIIPAYSTLLLPPTWKQTRAITQLCMKVGITDELEHTPSNRREARDLIYKLRFQLKEKNREKSPD